MDIITPNMNNMQLSGNKADKDILKPSPIVSAFICICIFFFFENSPSGLFIKMWWVNLYATTTAFLATYGEAYILSHVRSMEI